MAQQGVLMAQQGAILQQQGALLQQQGAGLQQGDNSALTGGQPLADHFSEDFLQSICNIFGDDDDGLLQPDRRLPDDGDGRLQPDMPTSTHSTITDMSPSPHRVSPGSTITDTSQKTFHKENP